MKLEPALIVTDMDGTFLGPHGALIRENCLALARAEARGIPVAFASGRLAPVLSRFALRAGLKNCAILGVNGAHVLRAPFGQTEVLRPIPGPVFSRCLTILDGCGCLYSLYTDRGVYTNRLMTGEREADFRANFRDSGCVVETGPRAISRGLGDLPLKLMVFRGRQPEKALRARHSLEALEGLTFTTAREDTFEVISASAGKAGAVRDLARRLGVPLSRVMAIGDQDNDAEMLSLCGLSVAAAEASPAAAAAARLRAPRGEPTVAWAVTQALGEG